MNLRLAGTLVATGLLLASGTLLAAPGALREADEASAYQASSRAFGLFFAVAEREPVFRATSRRQILFTAVARPLPSFRAVARTGFRAVAGTGGLAFSSTSRAALRSALLGPETRSPGGDRTPSAAELGRQTSEEAELAEAFGGGDAFGSEEFGSGEVGGLQAGFQDPAPGLQGGFDDAPAGAGELANVQGLTVVGPSESAIDLDGSITLGAAYNFAQDSPEPGEADYRGLSRLRLGVDLGVEFDLPLGLSAKIAGRGFRDVSYALKDKDEFTHEVLQLYESELEFKEVFVRGSVGDNVDFQVGRQVLAWGSSETLRVLDVLSPLDNREPGLIDLRDLRLPVAATRVSYFGGPFRLTGIAIHESRFDEQPVFGSDFFPFDDPPPGEIRPANGGSDTEYAVALTGRFSSFDASLNWAQYFDDETHLDRDTGLLDHSRLNLIGASADIPLGNFLVRGEVARIRGLEFFGSRRKLSRNDVLLGIEYAGLSDQAITLELVARKLNGYQDEILDFPDGERENSFEGSLRYTARYLNDRARLNVLLIVFGQQAQDGTIYRVNFDYDLRDALTLGAGILLFEEGDLPPLSATDKNDRVFVNLRYSF